MDDLNEKIDDLKPCPFCGGNGMIYEDSSGFLQVVCVSCGAKSNGFSAPLILGQSRPRAALERAFEAWNSRKNDELFELDDTVWLLDNGTVVKGEICSIDRRKDPYFVGTVYCADVPTIMGERWGKLFDETDIGKEIFLTKEEAEKKLQER